MFGKQKDEKTYAIIPYNIKPQIGSADSLF